MPKLVTMKAWRLKIEPWGVCRPMVAAASKVKIGSGSASK
jgi:hypothetical protein